MPSDADIMLSNQTSDADIMMAGGSSDADIMLGIEEIKTPPPAPATKIPTRKIRTSSYLDSPEFKGNVLGRMFRETMRPGSEPRFQEPIVDKQWVQKEVDSWTSGFVDFFEDTPTHSRFAAMLPAPLRKTIRGVGDFFAAIPGFVLGILAVPDNAKMILGKEDASVEDLYEIMESDISDINNAVRKHITDQTLGVFTGEASPGSEVIGRTVMLPLEVMTRTANSISEWERFEDSPNIRGTIKFAGFGAGALAMGKLYHKGRRSEAINDVANIVNKTKDLETKYKENDLVLDEAVRIAQEKILNVEKMQLEREAKEIMDKLDYGEMVKEDLKGKGRQTKQIKQAKKYILDEQIDKAMRKLPEPKVEGYEFEYKGMWSPIEDAPKQPYWRITKSPNAKEVGSDISGRWFEDKGIEVPKVEKVEPVTELDLETSTLEPKELSFEEHPFREKPAVASTQYGRSVATDVDQLVSGIGEKDAWATVNKSLAEINEWADGAKIDVTRTRDLLSEMAARKEEMKGLVEDFETFEEVIDEAAIWARRARRQTTVDLNMMIPLDKIPELVAKILTSGKILTKNILRNKKIYDETGFWYDVSDRRWVYEVDDSKMDFTGRLKSGRNTGKLSSYINHPELFKAIPEMKDIYLDIEIDKSFVNPGGEFRVNGWNFKLGSIPKNKPIIHIMENSNKRAIESLIHEVQHVVDEITKAKYKGTGYLGKSRQEYMDNVGEMRARLASKRLTSKEKYPWETLNRMLYEENYNEGFNRGYIGSIQPGTKLYDIGGATAEGVKQLIKGADDFAKYLKSSKAYKQFKPIQATKMLKTELKRDFIDRSGNIRVDLVNSLGDQGYKIIQKMYLSKGASSRSAAMLKQMQKEVYRGLNRQEKEILDGMILADRMSDIASYKPKFKFPEYISSDGKVPDKTITWRETVKQRYKLSDEKLADLSRRAEAYFEWMKKPLKDMLDAELISAEEFEALASHNYRRIKLVDLIDKRYQAKVGRRKRTVYDSGVEALAKGRTTDIYESSSEIMALEVFNRAYGRIMNNEANKILLDLSRKDPENPFVRSKEGKQKIPSGWNRLFVYEGGQRKAIYLSPEMSKEWVINSPETSYRFSQFLRYSSGSPVLRTFATGINWGFALANLPRDVMHTWFTARRFEDGKWKHVYSPHAPIAGLQMVRDQLAVFEDAALRKGRYEDYINEGGGMEFMVHQGRILQRGRHLEGNIDKIQNFLGYFGETSEVMTRLAIRERAIKRGATPEEATFVARDYMDFGQGGGIAKALDNAVPYLNASIQGTRGLFRSMKENPIVSTYKLTQFAALTTGIYIAMKSRAPETEKNLRGSIDMTNNLVIPLGDEFGFLDEQGQMRYPYIKIPLDPSQRFFKKFFEASTDKWLGEEVDVAGTVDALNELTPVSVSGLPPTISGTLGYISNKDFWLNEDIWKQSEPFAWPGSREEYTSRTPEAFIDIGKVTGLSPERLRYGVSELVTNGTMWSYLAGEGYEKMFGDLPKEKKEEHLAMVLSEMPVAKRFIGVTNPYSKYAEKIDKAQEEVVLKQFVENRNFDILVEGYLYGKKGEVTMKDIQKEANQYKDVETYERLMKRLEFERGIRKLPEKSFWRRLKGLRTEAKAKVFVERLRSATPEERSQLWKEASIVLAAGGVISDEFFDAVNEQYIK